MSRNIYRRNSHTSHRDRHIPSTGFCLGSAANGRGSMSPDLLISIHPRTRNPGIKKERKTNRKLTPGDLSQIPNPTINHRPANTHILHPHSHDPTQHSTMLSSRLVYHGYRPRFSPVNPMRACREPVLVFRAGFGLWQGKAGLRDEFEG